LFIDIELFVPTLAKLKRDLVISQYPTGQVL